MHQILRMSHSQTNFKLSIHVEKQGFIVKNSIQRSTSPFMAEASIYQISNLPRYLAPAVDRALSLPLRIYDLELQNIISMAIIGWSYQETRYITPLDPRIVINHFDPIFNTPDLTCCKYDANTVITFSENQDNTIRFEV